MYPYMSSDDMSSITESFKRNVNFWYPTMSNAKIRALEIMVAHGELGSSTTSTLALLTLALGCASQYIETYYCTELSNDMGLQDDRSRISMANMYFDGVLKNIHIAHMEMTSAATQCLFLAG